MDARQRGCPLWKRSTMRKHAADTLGDYVCHAWETFDLRLKVLS